MERELRRITWLGQAGFRVEIGATVAVVDPWVSPHEGRLIPPPPLEAAAAGVDVVLVTHEHLDHLDVDFLPLLLERSPAAHVVVPEPAAPLVDGIVPPDRLVRVRPGEDIVLAGLRIRVTPALHGIAPEDAYGDGTALGGPPRFVGYVLGEANGIYHAGDTIVTDELRTALRPMEIEIALLPINGRDEKRESQGIVGNMDASEAVELAAEIGASILVPMHWDGFAGNTVDPGEAVEAARGRIRVIVPAQLEPLEIEAA